MKKNILMPIITGVLSLFLGFFGGYLYQKGKQSAQRPTGMYGSLRTSSTTGTSNRDNLLKGNGPVSGKIIKMDDSSITVQTSDGSNKIVLLSDQTKINKTSDAAKTDLAQGVEIMVIGSTNNGAVTAQTINIGGSLPQQAVPSPSVTVN
jgi:hypothetical protein